MRIMANTESIRKSDRLIITFGFNDVLNHRTFKTRLDVWKINFTNLKLVDIIVNYKVPWSTEVNEKWASLIQTFAKVTTQNVQL